MSSIDDITMSSMASDTITLDTASIPYLTSNMIGPYYNVGTGGGGGTYYTTNGTSTSPYWQTITNAGSGSSGSLQVKGDAEFEGKVKVNGQDLGEFMETISKRLAILVPDPAKLEHFEALKKAYDHYKMLEKLCELPTETKE